MKTFVRPARTAAVAVVSIAVATVSVLAFGALESTAQAEVAAVEVWWPAEGADVSGIQPFKAVLSGRDLDQYEMYWQVDGGAQSKMEDVLEDHPHKESLVDVGAWSGPGSYQVTFIATRSGEELDRRTVTIDVSQSESVAPAYRISVWWPTAGARVTGVQPFKAVLDRAELADYRMLWQVDGGELHVMDDSHVDHPHKEDLVDLSKWTWNDTGRYEVSFVAESVDGRRLTARTIALQVPTDEPEPATTTSSSSTTTTTEPTTTSTTQPAPALKGATLYVDPSSPVRWEADAMRGSHPYEASLLDKIAEQPAAKWLGDWNGDIHAAVDEATDTITAAGAVPVYVAYNIPLRDCSGYSAGGSQGADEYRSWIRSFADGIGNRTAAVILEPDALALLDCLPDDLRAERLELLRFAVETLGAGGNTSVYIDAGHARWHSPEEAARRLKAAGVGAARGFSLNVSNFVNTTETVAYGEQVSDLIGDKPFVVDTSRNGVGASSDGEWCNPPGRALGSPPSTHTGNEAVDAYLWVKAPGESDGTCNGGPPAGEFWTDYALGLAERADW